MNVPPELRPKCPECQAPVRDIEAAHIDSQRAMGHITDKHWLVLFCGHKVEVTIEKEAVLLKRIS